MPALPLLAINALLMIAAASGLAGWADAAPQAVAHVALALGILPLILAAMAYFVPVLTRSGNTVARGLPLAPLAAWLGGLCLVAGFLNILPLAAATHAAATLAGGAALALLLWATHRARKTVGKPHPGLAWYLAALVCLATALLAVPLMSVWPAQRTALRLFHLHLNLLGFVGLTALGTLQVLLPTAAGRPDPKVAARLAGDLKYALVGVALLACGAAWLPPLALFGAVLYLVVPLRMLRDWWQAYRDLICQPHGALPSLAAATTSWAALLLLGGAHGLDTHHGALNNPLDGRAALIGYFLAFLLPLVSGAATQLLPVWLRPGPQREWHAQKRAALGWLGGVRALLMVAGGVLFSCGVAEGLGLALGGGLLLLLAAQRALR